MSEYPTADAYEAVCAARTKWQERAEAAERELAAANAALVDIRDRLGAFVDAAARAAAPTTRKPIECPAGHGVMHYSIEDDRLHCRCGAVASTRGLITVDPTYEGQKP